MNFVEFMQSKARGGPTADIRERWENRVVALGLTGAAGARAYLDRFGGRIGIQKLVRFAKLAAEKGDPAFAGVMWATAYEKETGRTAALRTDDDVITAPATPIEVAPLPPFSPGTVPTMQPQDTKENAEYFIERDEYWAQPKIDGMRMLAFIKSSGEIVGQRRTLTVHRGFTEAGAAIGEALQELGRLRGDFILDGEVYYESNTGSEHRTAPQALTGSDPEHDAKAQGMYAIFDCLYYAGEDITDKPFSERGPLAVEVYEFLAELTSENAMVLDSPYFRYVPIAKTKADKKRMYDGQRAAGREGIVFRKHASPYIAGKKKTAFRIKFVEDVVTQVIGLTPSPAGRAFGSLETEFGNVSSGLSNADIEDLAVRWENREFMGDIMIEVTTQGFTENGKFWHPRVKRILPNE